MHGRYDVGTAKRVAKELEPFQLLWLEEPVPPENVDAMRDVRESTHTPICCGENLFLRHGFRELLEKRAVDIIMPDIQKCGGLLEARKIADMAHTYYVPHGAALPGVADWNHGLLPRAGGDSQLPGARMALGPPGRTRRRSGSSTSRKARSSRRAIVTVTDRPGIGLEMNDEAVRKMQPPGSAWFTA